MLPAVISKLVTDTPYALIEGDSKQTDNCTVLYMQKTVPDCSGTESSPDIRGCSRSVPDKAGCRSPPAAMSLCASSHLLLAFLASSCQSTCSIEPKHSTAACHSTFIHSCKKLISWLQRKIACLNQMVHRLLYCVVLLQAPKDESELI